MSSDTTRHREDAAVHTVGTSSAPRVETPGIRWFSPHPLVQVVEVRRDAASEFYVTVVPPAGRGDDCLRAVKVVYDALTGFLAEHDANVVHEKLYAPASLYDIIEETRSECYRARGVRAGNAWGLISGRAWEPGRVGGLHVHAISGKTARTSDILTGSRSTGKIVEWGGARYIYLSFITGEDESGRLPDGGEAQARRMFDNAYTLLEANGSHFSRVARIWIYLPHILQWYREFNAARTAAFEKFGLWEDSWPGILPASTGIQGAGPSGAQCFLDLVAVEPLAGKSVEVRRINNPRQSEATSYGSSFSRAATVTHGGITQLFVSGTASINERGETVHVDDLEGQIFHTLMNVGTLLDLEGRGLSDICMATAFFKKAEYIPAFEKIRRTLGIPSFPVVSIVADVCRHDLLFELEATAVYRAGE